MTKNNRWATLLAVSFSMQATAQSDGMEPAQVVAPMPDTSHSTTAATPQYQQMMERRAPMVEEIPTDIWSTIASPFDPISSGQNFMPQRQMPAPMQPRHEVSNEVVAQPPMSTFAPPSQPQPQPQQNIRYPVQPIPYELPPQEKVVAEYPEEYWNCLLNNLQGLGSDVAAKLITRACQKKYPKR